MVRHSELDDMELRNRLRRKEFVLGGNRLLKIYGKLGCASGRRLKKENRVFFSSEDDALQNDYRPCGHCMKEEYKAWIYSTNR